MYGNIHSAKRNRLGNETAMKLVFIAQNFKFCANAHEISNKQKSDSNAIEASKPLDVADDNFDMLEESEDEDSFDNDDSDSASVNASDSD